MLVFIGKLSLSTLIWVPICQGFSHVSVFLHHFVLGKLAISMRVNTFVPRDLLYNCWTRPLLYFNEHSVFIYFIYEQDYIIIYEQDLCYISMNIVYLFISKIIED